MEGLIEAKYKEIFKNAGREDLANKLQKKFEASENEKTKNIYFLPQHLKNLQHIIDFDKNCIINPKIVVWN